MDGSPPDGGRSSPRPARLARIGCHVAVVTPFLVACVLEMSRGWRPTADDANLAFRSWTVLSAHSPLVGQYSQASSFGSGHPIYNLGPLLQWLLTIPVHLDHAQGVLWGAALLCAAGASVAVEAAWSARGWQGSLGVAAVLLVIVAAHPSVAMDPAWNPYVGLVWFVATAALSWAVASGRLRWWPVLVLAASLASQSHLMFAAGALACVIVAPVVGLLARRRLGWWLPAGVAVGAACWAAPLVQQLTTSPGNVSLLIQAQSRGGHGVGGAFALQSLAAATGPGPIWGGGTDMTSAYAVVGAITSHAPAAGAAVLGALALVCAGGWAAHKRDLATLALVDLVLAIAVVWSIAVLPGQQILSIEYIDLVTWPVGLTALAVLGWGLGSGGNWLVRRAATRYGSPREPLTARTLGRRIALASTAIALAGTSLVSALVVAQDAGGDAVQIGGWRTVALVGPVTAQIERAVHRGPVEVEPAQTGNVLPLTYSAALVAGVAWNLHADGWQPRLQPLFALRVGYPVLAPPAASTPVATVFYSADSSHVVVALPQRRHHCVV